MRPYKAQKIDFNTEYPCPCRRKGNLSPIVLTEAFGCDRCQQIFVVQDNGQIIEQLSSHYPYKRSWHWNGKNWLSANSFWSDSYFPITSGIILVLLIVWLPIALQTFSSQGIIVLTAIAILALSLPAIIFWLAQRR